MHREKQEVVQAAVLTQHWLWFSVYPPPKNGCSKQRLPWRRDAGRICSGFIGLVLGGRQSAGIRAGTCRAG